MRTSGWWLKVASVFRAIDLRTLVSCVPLAAISLSGCAGGQPQAVPSGALQIGGESPREKSRPLSVDKLGGFLGAGYLFNQQKQSPGAIESTTHLVEERGGAGASGSVYSPNLFQYEATGVLGLREEWASSPTESAYDTGNLYEADVSGHFFPKRFHPANLYYSRIQDIQPQIFYSTVENTTSTAQGEQQLLFSDGSLRFEAGRRETEQVVFGGEQAPFLDAQEDWIGGNGDWRIGRHQTVSAGYTYNDVQQSVEENSFTAHNFNGNHTLLLGSDNQHQLRSRLEGISQNGYQDQQLLRVDELFSSEVTERLRADSGFHFENNDTNIVNLQQIRGDGGLTHRLFESLTTTLRAQGGRIQTENQSTTDDVGGSLGFNYQKKNPLGMLRMGYNAFLERRFVTNDQGGAIDERHTFPLVPPDEVRLSGRQIDPRSIVLTDLSGLLFYREGIDYTIRQDPAGFTYIERIFTGLIPLAGTILVDYTNQLGADYILDSMFQTFRLEHEFLGGITPYFSLNYQDQHVVEEDFPGAVVPVRERGLIGGLEWRRSRFTVGGEYEDRKSTNVPFDAVRLRGTASTPIGEIQTLTFTAAQVWIYYKEPVRDSSIAQGIAHYQALFARNSRIFLDGAIHYEKDSLAGESWGYSVGGGVEYYWRKFSIRLRAAHRKTNGVSSDYRDEELGIFIVREFGGPPSSTIAAENRFLKQ